MLIAYFPFVAFRALRLAEQFRDEAGETRRSSLAPGLLLWFPLSVAVLAFYIFAVPNLYPIPENVPARGLLAGDIVLLEPSNAEPPKDESARRAALAKRARWIVWSFEAPADDFKTGRFGTIIMYSRARWDRIPRKL